ncbi:hypothetical protein [Actinomadura alba]|uniref:Uncharacterized protein n=1 Tax=Actinomadura alba TaxID=406431 RepID=A0ABR7LKD7_9ACTN|nr:hypothetical protein [Actinomadura alba]MBC6464848.1 hypothetical protein [Actinomadura alba]
MPLGTVTRPVAAFAAVTALGALIGISPMARAEAEPGTTEWRIAAIDESRLGDVVAIGPDDAWAFGGTYDGRFAPVARHWNGRKWTTAELPSGLERVISVADASGPRNVWAFGGGDSAGEAYALRWDGHRWRVTKRWPAGQHIADAEVIGPRDVWVFGDGRIGESVGTWHFDGRRWTRVETPAWGLQEASAVASDDVWAVGFGPEHPWGDLLARWDGRTWSEVTVPGLPREDDHYVGFNGIHATSSRDVWIVGHETRVDGESYTSSPLVLRFDGATWRRVEPSVGTEPQGLLDVTPDGRGGVWLRPEYWEQNGNPDLLHFGQGRWTEVRLPRPQGGEVYVSDVTAVPRSAFTWAVGRVSSPEAGDSGGVIWVNGGRPR